MNIQSQVVAARGVGHLPEIDRLFPLEREIAELVYARGCVTAKEVEAGLSRPLSNPAVRSMLNRLVRKGLLVRHELKPPSAFVYGPAITRAAAEENAIRQCAEDFFGGSIDQVATDLAQLFRRKSAQRPARSPAPRRAPVAISADASPAAPSRYARGAG